jgi:hypothetical protein
MPSETKIGGTVNVDALKSEIRKAIINKKVNACPIAIRLAWHSSGTWDAASKTGGSDGATMRFAPESTDEANAGLSIPRDMLKRVKAAHPNVSRADLWALAGASAVEFLGGPKIRVRLGRTDDADGARCPANGRLPDAAQGAQHLRDIFHRMGFSDREIVALSGAHTLGRCHLTRSGFDGPWTRNPLKFDNQYFKLLLGLDWTPRQWEGNFQYQDPTGTLMMLPTDMALKTDPEFRRWAEKYAADEQLFFDDFAAAFAKLLAFGVRADAAQRPPASASSADGVVAEASARLQEAAMHGSLAAVVQLAEAKREAGVEPTRYDGRADASSVERSSQRTALHKAAFWGHVLVTRYLCRGARARNRDTGDRRVPEALRTVDVDARDYNGDTPLHDAARFGHMDVIRELLAAHASTDARNNEGLTAEDLATEQGYEAAAQLLRSGATSGSGLQSRL